jgi:nitronate monooxygenase
MLPTLFSRLTLPLIGAPLFIVSYPALVIAQCRAGIIGTFPALNARPAAELDRWLTEIETALGPDAVPFGVNLIVHASNTRLAEDLATCAAHRVPLIITSVGAPSAVVETVHGYGGLVFHDVTTLRHAEKALVAGVDGLILVAAGAGGHAGLLSPFALVEEIRQIYTGPLVLSGAITRGHQIRAAQVMGADLAYMGTRFIATQEANASPDYKQALLAASARDIVYTPVFTGIPANYLSASIVAAGYDPAKIVGGVTHPDFTTAAGEAKAWKDIWGAGHGVGSIHDLPSVAELVERLRREYEGAL